MSGVILNRFLDLTVDTIRVVHDPPGIGLRVEFDATKTLRQEPNECEVKIYNLSPEHRNQLSKVKTPVVTLVAGYKDEHCPIFVGQAIHVHHERRGPDIVTVCSTTDSGKAYQTARIFKAFGPHTKAGDVLKALGQAMGVSPGNIASAAQKLNAGKAADVYIGGVVLSGHAPHYMRTLCESAGLEWSVQDGKLQFLDRGKALAGAAIKLTDANLTVTPAVSAKSVCEGQTFIQKDFIPGRQIQVSSEFVNGVFRLEKCKYTGDTHADQWFVDFEAQGKRP